MIIIEYRIVMPLTVEEYQIGQLYGVAEMSKNETHGGEGIEILVNEPYSDSNSTGQYTHKVYHLSSRVPSWIRLLSPASALKIDEKAWNAYPYCKTIMTNQFMEDKFSLIVETRHAADRGTQENIHNLPPDLLAKRQVEFIDIVKDPIEPKDYSEKTDPSKYKSTKTNRGMLPPDWREKPLEPVMCCYKLITVEFKVMGVQSRVEKFIHQASRYQMLKLHRQIFCWLDNYVDLTLEQIREIEEQTKRELAEKLAKEQQQHHHHHHGKKAIKDTAAA